MPSFHVILVTILKLSQGKQMKAQGKRSKEKQRKSGKYILKYYFYHIVHKLKNQLITVESLLSGV